ncbi:PREDICTED: serine protease easter-like isoform X1 [Nicrophorus vespilloides]|uniref:CLIP domain-containing serine protease n=2 Tax=Nicrophorus vespilloides TaxID=110193 RepID=A0ABM1MGG7_NICVS|nr:PREDICTED: serine protease easter-like isoform X1 [Nicrophorus vespilloides]
MASKITTASAVLLLLSSLLLVTSQDIIFPEWAIDDDGCRTPDRGVGTCIPVHDCKHVVDFIEKSPKPLSAEDLKRLQSYQCGFSGKTIKVCCPKKAIVRPDTTSKPDLVDNRIQDTPPDVTNHRNLGLLSKACGSLGTEDRITNGNTTGLFEFPWMVLLSYQTGSGLDFRCGGTLINDRYVLTAAHCITELKFPLRGVRLGEHDFSTEQDCETSLDGDTVCSPPYQDMGIEKVIPHPLYNRTALQNDIGLLRLARAAKTDQDNIKPICLPYTKETREVKVDKYLVTGWGQTEKKTRSTALLKVFVDAMNYEECQEVYKNLTITRRQICAGGKASRDSCTGDSGGPIQTAGSLDFDAKYIQYGVVSFGPKNCGQSGLPGVYTSVAHYLHWILDNITS